MNAITSKADLNDQRWLDQRIEAIDDGIEAVLDIARNWTDLRNLSRLHPGTSAQDYILARVKTPLGRGVVVPLLAESNWSNRQIAKVAGVSEGTVRSTAQNYAVDRPAETLGADGKLRPARVVREVVAEIVEPEEAPVESVLWTDLTHVADLIEALASNQPSDVAMAVPRRRRATTAKRLRLLGTHLGRIALCLENMEGDEE